MQGGHPSLSTRLRNVSSELRAIDLELKAEHVTTDKALLHEFRQAIDDVRFTAWTVNELMNARDSHRNTEPLQSFLISERIRRLSYMIRDLCADMDKEFVTGQNTALQNLSDSLPVLQTRITKVIANHR